MAFVSSKKKQCHGVSLQLHNNIHLDINILCDRSIFSHKLTFALKLEDYYKKSTMLKKRDWTTTACKITHGDRPASIGPNLRAFPITLGRSRRLQHFRGGFAVSTRYIREITQAQRLTCGNSREEDIQQYNGTYFKH